MAIKVAPTANIIHEDWLALRRQGLGGSDAATLLGLNPYGSLLTLYADKLGLLPEREDSFPIRFGKRFEDFVAEQWAQETGMSVERDDYLYRHEQYPFMQANIDRRVVGENAGLECKTTGRFERSAFVDGTVERYYAAQCQWYIEVMGFDCMYLAVLDRITGAFRHYTVERDEAFIHRMIEAGRDFWVNHVFSRCPPEPDGSDACADAIQLLYPSKGTQGGVQIPQHDGDLAEYVALGREIKALEQRQAAAKQRIQISMGEHTAGVTARYKVSWKPFQRTGLDIEAMGAAHPDLVRYYEKITTVRPFRVTAQKG